MAEHLPELRGHVRRPGLEQRDGGLRGEARAGRGGVVGQLVDQLHHRRDRRVELHPPADIVGDPLDRLVGLADERPVARVALGRLLGDLVDDAPQAPDEPRDALDPRIRPLHVLVGRAHEEDVEAHRSAP